MSILKINSANPGIKRPIKVEDLANIWEGFDSALAQGTDTTPRIICGFNVVNTSLTSGAIAYKGKVYVLPASDIAALGDDLYAVEEPTGDNRVMGDGTTQLFSYARRIGVSSKPGAIYIGEATTGNLNLWKNAFLAPGSVVGDMIADDSISSDKIQQGAVGTNEIADLAITTRKIANGAITAEVIKGGAVTMEKIASGAVYTNQLANNAVTRDKTANGVGTKFYITNVNITTDSQRFILNLDTIFYVTITTATTGGCIAVLDDLPSNSVAKMIVANSRSVDVTMRLYVNNLGVANLNIPGDSSSIVTIFMDEYPNLFYATLNKCDQFVHYQL